MKKTTLLRLTAVSLFFMTLPVRAGQTGDDRRVEPAFTSAEISAANSDPLKFTIDPDSIRVVRKAH
ncbi:MAG TPA: hypothetical protein PL037_06080, partial [Elusimicrobiales bacterium]|nr:hypothetical protein [Elusimicrobiales bacterium]